MLSRILNNSQPDKIAYRINEQYITYSKLTEKAKHYGELLKRQGNSPVIVYGHKSIDMFVSIFACLHSGRAYIPVDLYTPVDRVKKIIGCSGSTLMITDEDIDINGIEKTALVGLGKYADEKIHPSSDNTAYIIFTSGSTGEPKGVPISCDNLVNFTKWISGLEPLCDYENVNVLNQASFGFDLSVADIYYAMANGHTLVALDKDSQESYSGIFEKISSEEINVMVVTPTFIKLCLVNKEFCSENYPSLKCIYFCGEQLEKETVRILFERFPELKVINAYGPTEATSAVSAVCITRGMLDGELLPVGTVDNFATDIVIENKEIVLKGESVSDGYLGKVKGGFYKDCNINCFRTGDIGFIKGNCLYCKGRMDSQIKFKGYRIELNDIESNIYKIKGVNQCAVVAKYKDRFNIRLIKAFVVLDDGYDTDYVKSELKKLIPLYMVPKSFVQLDSLPMNANGKTDRKKLMEL